MCKTVAVFGSPGSGKTTLAYKLALDVYHQVENSKVCLLSPDLIVPSIGIFFPNDDPRYVTSLANVFDNPTIDFDILMGNAMTVKSYSDFCVLGFKCGDSKSSYPDYSNMKLAELFDVIKSAFDYLFVDCSNNTDDRISAFGFKTADFIVEVITPDLKGVSFVSSNKSMLCLPDEKIIKGINETGTDVIFDVRAAEDVLKSCKFHLPYSKLLKRQFNEGTLTSTQFDRAFEKELGKIGDLLI